MITLNPVVIPHQQRRDGTWNIKVRVTHNRQSAYIQTPHVVVKEQLNTDFSLNDNFVDLEIQEDILQMRKEVARSYTCLLPLSAKEIANHLTKIIYNHESNNINYPDFADKFILKKKKIGSGTYRNYEVSLSRLIQYVGHRSFTFNDITYNFLQNFDEWLENNGTGPRGRHMYLSNMKTIIKEAKKEFNDESSGKILIPRDPFAQFEMPAYGDAEKRALTIEQLIRIRDVELVKETHNMARDVFMMSFYLVGMNSVDLYRLDRIEDGRVVYNRSKTYRRRKDNAFISIKIEPEVTSLIEKYKRADNGPIFTFSSRYSDSNSFNIYINKYLKEVGNTVGIKNLQFYASRHTWATLFVNECKEPESEAAFCLNHVSEHKVTSGYIKKDFTRIDRANRKVMDLLI
jgi:integrase